jgi:hypothetical protein
MLQELPVKELKFCYKPMDSIAVEKVHGEGENAC